MDGILNVLKPSGMTSFDVVSQMRHIFHQKKIGHGGTLDPMAAGVLPVFLGRAARLIQYVPLSPKTYEAEFVKGISTDTEDMTGTVIRAENPSVLPDWDKVACSFRGRIRQVPSAYSAIRIHGRRAYDLARKGEKPEIPAREITIYRLDIRENTKAFLRLSVDCSSGTYIRALGRDMGRAAGVPLTLSFLLRTAMGPFRIEDSHTLEEIEKNPDSFVIQNPKDILASLPFVGLHKKEGKDFLQGKRLRCDMKDMPVCAVFSGEDFLGIASVSCGVIHPKKVFN